MEAGAWAPGCYTSSEGTRLPWSAGRGGVYHTGMHRLGGETGEEWIEITDRELSAAEALSWAVTPSCGAVVTFCGTVRDHSEGRTGVVSLEYEAFEEHVVPRLITIAAAARSRWPTIGRVALLHRVGQLELAETSVVVVVSSPHRREAFEAALFCIDTLKETVPIWKKERWDGGVDWSTCSHGIETLDAPRQSERADADGQVQGLLRSQS